jgi:hypothetical protein
MMAMHRVVSMNNDEDEDGGNRQPVLLLRSETVDCRWRHIGLYQRIIFFSSGYGSNNHASFYAIVDPICGARLFIFDFQRPNADS